MNWQIVALILGILLLLVSFLELLGEIKKKRLLRTLKEGGDLPIFFPDIPSTTTGSQRKTIDSTQLYKHDIIQQFESSTAEQKTEFLHYLQKKKLAEMDLTHLSGIWWLLISVFRHFYAGAKHQHPHPAEKKVPMRRP